MEFLSFMNEVVDATALELAKVTNETFHDHQLRVKVFIGDENFQALLHTRISEEAAEGTVRRTKVFIDRLKHLTFREACQNAAAATTLGAEAMETDSTGIIMAGLFLWATVREMSCKNISGPEVIGVSLLAKAKDSRMSKDAWTASLVEECKKREIPINQKTTVNAASTLQKIGVMTSEGSNYVLTDKVVFYDSEDPV